MILLRVSTGVSTAVVAGAAALASVTGDRTAVASVDCIQKGPIQLSSPITAAHRAAVPLASRGNAFISFANSRSVLVIDLATGARTSIPAGVSDPHEVAVSPDGRWGVAADFGDYTGDYNFDGRRLAVYDLRTKQLARVIDLGQYHGPHEVVFISPTRLVVTTQTTRNVAEVDVVSGRVLGATETRAKGSHTLAVTSDGRFGFTANEPEGSVSRLDLANRRFVAKFDVGNGSTEGIAVTPDGREIWMGFEEGGAGAVQILDGQSGRVVQRLTGFMQPQRMAMSANGRYAVITDFKCETVQVADVAAKRLLGAVEGLDGAGVAKVLPDNRTAIVLVLDEMILAMVDLETRKVISKHKLASRPDAAAWGPNP